MRTRHFSVGAALVAAAIAGGAVGAHGLRATLDPQGLELWRTAFHYLALTGVGMLAAGLALEARPAPLFAAAGAMVGAGGTLFAATVAGLALGGPRWLGAITPVGGILMIAGFAAMAAAAWRR